MASKEAAKDDCPWCRYMKGGGCRQQFEAWQACVDGAMGDDLDAAGRRAAVDACANVTAPLFECMIRHKDYYGPQLAEMGGGGGGAAAAGAPAAAGQGGGGSGAASGSGGNNSSSGGSGGGGSTSTVRVSAGQASTQTAAHS